VLTDVNVVSFSGLVFVVLTCTLKKGKKIRYIVYLFISNRYIEPITNLTVNDNVKYGSQTYHFPSAWMEKDGRICRVDCRKNNDERKKDFAHFVNLCR